MNEMNLVTATEVDVGIKPADWHQPSGVGAPWCGDVGLEREDLESVIAVIGDRAADWRAVGGLLGNALATELESLARFLRLQ